MHTARRLVLRPFRPDDDLPAYLSYYNDPEIRRFQGKSTPMSEEEGRVFLSEMSTAVLDPKVMKEKGGVQIAVALAGDSESTLVGDLYFALHEV